MFWEPVAEGEVRDSRASILLVVISITALDQEPVLPTALKRTREDAKRHGRSEESTKSGDMLRLLQDDRTEIANTSGTAPGRHDQVH